MKEDSQVIEKTKFYSAYKGPKWKAPNTHNLDKYENYLHEIKVTVDTSGCNTSNGVAKVTIEFHSTVSFIVGALYARITKSGLRLDDTHFFPATAEDPTAQVKGSTWSSVATNVFEIPCGGKNIKRKLFYDTEPTVGAASRYEIEITINLASGGVDRSVDFLLHFGDDAYNAMQDKFLMEISGKDDPKRPPHKFP